MRWFTTVAAVLGAGPVDRARRRRLASPPSALDPFAAATGKTRSRANALLSIVGLVVSAVFAFFAVRHVRPGDVAAALGHANVWWLVPAVAALAAANALRALRWQCLFRGATRPPYRPVLSAMLLGQFFNNILPARAGEAARVIDLHRSSDTSRAETVGTIVIERAYDVLSVLALLFLTLPWLPHVSWLRAAGFLALALVVGLVTGFVVLALYGDRLLRLVARVLARVPFLPLARTERAAKNLLHGFAGLRRPRLAATALMWSLVSWLVLGVSAWFAMRALHLGLSPAASLLVMIATGLAAILPSSPAAVGVFEAAALVALKAYHVPKAEALSYALTLHALNFAPYIVAGVAILGARVLSARSSAPAASPTP